MPRIYSFREEWAPAEFPSALAIGDSWFWYLNDGILGTLTKHPNTSLNHCNIQRVGYNGALLQEYVGAGKFAKQVTYYLHRNWRDAFSEFYISGAGNDAVDYGLALKSNCSGASSGAACIDQDGLDELLRRVSTAMGGLIHDIRWAYRDDTQLRRPIFIHGYDYPVPDGRGFLSDHAWFKPAMDKARVPNDPTLRREITIILIDALNDQAFSPFDSAENEVVYINCRGTLDDSPTGYKNDWSNELHPTNAGFHKIYEKCWLAELKQYGIAL